MSSQLPLRAVQIALLLFSVFTYSQTQITVDQATSGDVKEATSLTINHTVSTGLNYKAAIVSVMINGTTSTATISTLTYGGVSMTLHESAGTDGRLLAVYSVLNPPAGNNAVSITTSGGNRDISLGVVGFANVDQNIIFSSLQSEAAQSTNLSKNLNCNPYGLVMDFMVLDDSTGAPGSGQTLLYDDLNPNGSERIYSSYKIATAGTDTLNWTWSDAEYIYIWGCMQAVDPCDPLSSGNTDNDKDGIVDICEVDDDNDGILDAIECIDLGKYPLLNADFEDLDILALDGGPTDVVGAAGIWKGDASNIPNWESADPINNYLEIWHNTQVAGDDVGGLAYSGTQWAEINASTNDGLYQDIATTPGDVLQWSFVHRKRTGYAGSATEDIARLLIGDPTGPLSQGDFSSAGDASWTVHSGTYTVPAGQTTTRLTFTWVASVSGSSSSGNFVDNVQLYIIPNCQDTDGDSIPDYLDIDSDNDGIPDNVEAQSTAGYILPSGTVNPSGTYAGLWDNYGTGLSLENTDGIDEFDYLDLDSDNDGIPDIQENGMANSFTVIDSDNDGLKNVFETTGVNDAVWDPNEDIEDPTDLSILPDTDGDLALGGDLDYRDLLDINPPSSSTIDFDGIDDYISTPSFMSGYQNATMMAWIKLDATFSATGDIAGHSMMRMYVDSARKLRSYYITNASNSAYGSSAPATLNVEQWYHVAISYEGATGFVKIYVNGELVTQSTIPSGTLSTNATYTSHEFNVGRHSRLSNSYFKGDIDEVRIFSKVLTDKQLKRMVYQEIEQNGTDVKGAVLPHNIDENLSDPLLWSDLEVYYPMTNILTGFKTNDYSSNSLTATLNNITTIQPQTAPMPYETTADGDWSTEATWLYGDVWDIEDIAKNKDWSIVHVKNDVTTSASHSQLGMFIDSGMSLTVSGDNAITNNWYLQLDGTIDLADDSQLIQTENSDLVTSSTGKIQRRQEGHSNVYRYNYWSSPVGTTGVTTLSDNNGPSNNANNSLFSIDMLMDGTGTTAMQFTSAFDEVGKISNRWLYSFQNGLTYYDWTTLAPTSGIQPGVGYTQKGTGNAGIEQQYTFEGKPNNGTILVAANDVDGDSGNESQQDITLTTLLIGNPYPSALDADEFIRDNTDFDNGGLNPTIEGTILLWEQWAGTSHWLSEYEGGYGYINLTETVRAYQHPDIVIADPTNSDNRGIKTPTKFIPVGQAFFVEVIEDGNIEFNNGQRVFKDENSGESVFFRGTQSQENMTNDEITARDADTTVAGPMQTIKLEFGVSNGATRRFVLGFSETTTDGFDPGYDGGLITQTPDEDMTSLMDGKPYVIQAFSPISPEKEIDLYFNSSGNNTYVLDIAELNNIDENQDIFIKDNKQNLYWNLTNHGAYHFSAFTGEDSERFDIVFSDDNTLSNSNFVLSDLLIYVNNSENKLFVKGLEQQVKRLALINMLGQTVKIYNDIDIYDLENGVYTGELSAGVYFVNLTTENNIKRNKKIILE